MCVYLLTDVFDCMGTGQLKSLMSVVKSSNNDCLHNHIKLSE